MTLALIGAAIVWLIASPTAALVLGRVLRHRDSQIPAPSTGEVGEAPARRGAHLRLVR